MGSKCKSSKKSHRSKDKDSEHHRKYKRRRHDTSPPQTSLPAPQHLLIAAALGDKSRCRSLLRHGANLHYCDAEFTTPLHAASREGHLEIVELFLRRNAHADMQDLKGNTPAHLAAKNGHLEIVNALLKSKTIGSLKEPNDKGQTVEQLIDAVMREQATKAELAQEHHARSTRSRGRDPGTYNLFPHSNLNGDTCNNIFSHASEGEGELEGMDDETRWRERLQREMSPLGDDHFGAFYGDDWHADEYETAEEYAKRIWREMEERKQRNNVFLDAVRRSKYVGRKHRKGKCFGQYCNAYNCSPGMSYFTLLSKNVTIYFAYYSIIYPQTKFSLKDDF